MTAQEISQGFDFSQLDGASWQFVQDARDEIQRLRNQTGKNLLELGRLLIEVKDRLPHGQFGPWLMAEFRWSDRHARRLMRVAEVFESDSESDLLVAFLEPAALHALAAPSTPESAVKEVKARVVQGEVIPPKKVKEIVERHKPPRQRQAPYLPHGDPRAMVIEGIGIEPAPDVSDKRPSYLGWFENLAASKAWTPAGQALLPTLTHLLRALDWTKEQAAEWAIELERYDLNRLISELGPLTAKMGELVHVAKQERKRRASDLVDESAVPPDANGLGAQLRDYRKARNFGQVELAILLGISQATLSKIETGALKPKADLLERIESVLEDQTNVAPPDDEQDRVRKQLLSMRDLAPTVLATQAGIKPQARIWPYLRGQRMKPENFRKLVAALEELPRSKS